MPEIKQLQKGLSASNVLSSARENPALWKTMKLTSEDVLQEHVQKLTAKSAGQHRCCTRKAKGAVLKKKRRLSLHISEW